MAQMSSRDTKLLCSLFIVIGLVAVGIGIWMFSKSLRAEHWPVTDGIVQSAEMKSQSGNHGSTTYSAEVTYTYQVAGASYTGDKVSIGQMSSSSGYAQGILNRYPVGKKISVHYSPGDPADAVLETGIHGGMWICLGVGTAFTLFGFMFLQIQKAAARAQMPGAAESSSVTVQPDGSVTMDKPPVLMGVIFLLVGIGLCFMHPDSDKPGWLMYAVGGMFASGGVMLLLMRLENKVYSKIATLLMLLAFLAVFHWVSFGAGERNGTMSTPFFVKQGVSVRTPFAIFTILLDVLLVAGWLYALLSGRFVAENKLKVPLVASLIFLVALLGIFFAFNKKLRQCDRQRKRPLFPPRLTTRSGSNSTAAVPTNIASNSRPRRPCSWCVKAIMPSIPRTAWARIMAGWTTGWRTWASPFPSSWRTPTARIIRTRNFPRRGPTAIGPVAMT
jgi:preprotein translocase subunit SecG/cbb3-type cytochrome oxidase subunit 3